MFFLLLLPNINICVLYWIKNSLKQSACIYTPRFCATTNEKSWIEKCLAQLSCEGCLGLVRVAVWISCNFQASSRRLEGLNTWPETRTPDLDILHRVLFPNCLHARFHREQPCSFAYKFWTADLYSLFYQRGKWLYF